MFSSKRRFLLFVFLIVFLGLPYILQYSGLQNQLQISHKASSVLNKIADLMPQMSYTRICSNKTSNVSSINTNKCFDITISNLFRMGHCLNTTGTNSSSCVNYLVLKLAHGRFGNDMFQLASLLGVARRNNFIPVVNEQLKITKLFNLPDFSQPFPITNLKTMATGPWGVYSTATEHLHPGHNWTLVGFVQSWRYFDDILDTVKTVFTIDPRIKTKVTSVLKSLGKPGICKIAINN